MRLKTFFRSSDPKIAKRRGMLLIATGVLLVAIALFWRFLVPSGAETPTGYYRVTGIYAEGGFSEPLYVQSISIERHGLIFEGASGGVVTGEHHIRQINGPLVLICGAQRGSPIDAQISHHHRRIRVKLGQCEVDGVRS
jgi:hypothetical protein